jgi:parallel beta-helix repeat protein
VGWGGFGETGESNKFFNLNGFTLTLGAFGLISDHITMRNGTVKLLGSNFRVFGKAVTLSNLFFDGSTVAPLSGMEAGTDLTVNNCTFSNFPSNALTFYYGQGGGLIKNSVFIGNKTAISLQLPAGVLIENNTFVRNGRGVNLYDEEGAGVNNNTIRHNTFQKNGVGINLFAHSASYQPTYPSLQGNQIIGNLIDRSSRSGLYIKLTCNPHPSSPFDCAGQNTLVSRNQFNHNGFSSDTGEIDDNDGVVAQANISSGEAYSPGLVGVTLANNRANQNADLGFDVNGVTDGGGNTGKSNGNPAQCDGVVCGGQFSASGAVSFNALPTEIQSISLETIPEAPLPSDQVSHHKNVVQ